MIASRSSQSIRRQKPSRRPSGKLERVRRQAAEVASQVAEGARSAAEQLKRQLVETMQNVAETATEEAERLFEAHRERAAIRVGGVGKATRQAAHALHAVRMTPLAQYLEAAAKQAQKASTYLKEKSMSELMEDSAELVRRNGAVAIGTLVLAGFATARFLKATAEREEAGGGEADEDKDD